MPCAPIRYNERLAAIAQRERFVRRVTSLVGCRALRWRGNRVDSAQDASGVRSGNTQGRKQEQCDQSYHGNGIDKKSHRTPKSQQLYAKHEKILVSDTWS